MGEIVQASSGRGRGREGKVRILSDGMDVATVRMDRINQHRDGRGGGDQGGVHRTVVVGVPKRLKEGDIADAGRRTDGLRRICT